MTVKRAGALAVGVAMVLAQLLVVWVSPAAAAPTWQGEYFANPTLQGAPVLTRTDPDIDFDWGAGSPDASVPVDQFSARWTTTITVEAGTYRFTTLTDDGVRLFVGGALVIDKFVGQSPTAWHADVALTAGDHVVIMEYFEGTGDAVARLTYAPILTQPPVDAWLAEFFGNPNLASQPIASRADPAIDFDFGSGSPLPGVPINNFSVRWTQTLTVTTAGTYQLHTETDDGVRVRIDGALLIDDWTEHAPVVNDVDVALTAGPHAFVVEYFDAFGDAVARFSVNLPPVAKAGPDRTVGNNKNFTLDASGSSSSGSGPLQYAWTQIGGTPVAVIRDEDQAVTIVEGVAGPTTLTFRVTVTGPTGVHTDDVVVTVRAPK